MPLSSSAVVNRSELLRLVSQLEAALPEAFAASDKVHSDRDQVVADGRNEAEQIVSDARSERARLVSETDVHMLAKGAADKLLADAAAEAEALRRDTDEYVDQRLANFEIALQKTLDAVTRGRDRLHGRSGLDQVSREDDAPFQFPGSD